MTDVFKQFIQSSTIGNLIDKVKPIEQQRDLIDLPATATIEEALDLLLAEDIKSVPIYELDQNEKKYIMIVSALDLLRLICSQVRGKKTVHGQYNNHIILDYRRYQLPN